MPTIHIHLELSSTYVRKVKAAFTNIKLITLFPKKVNLPLVFSHFSITWGHTTPYELGLDINKDDVVHVVP